MTIQLSQKAPRLHHGAYGHSHCSSHCSSPNSNLAMIKKKTGEGRTS